MFFDYLFNDGGNKRQGNNQEQVSEYFYDHFNYSVQQSFSRFLARSVPIKKGLTIQFLATDKLIQE